MKINKMLKYQLQTYFKGSSFVIPLVITAIFLYVMYSFKPLEIISSVLMSGTFMFFVMVWIGLSAAQSEQTTVEQILYLRAGSAVSYYAAKFLFLLCITVLLDCLYTFFPVIQNKLNGSDMFLGNLGTFEIVNAFMLQLGMALSGAALGNLFHPRVLKDRKLAIVLTVFVSVLSFTRQAITQRNPIFEYVLWIFPPVTKVSEVYGNATAFQLGQTMAILGIMLGYAVVYGTVKGVICHKRLF